MESSKTPTFRFSGWLFAAALLGLLIYSSLSAPPVRDSAYLLDALIKERRGLDFLGDANARQAGLEGYRQELESANRAGQLDTDEAHKALITEIAGSIIREASNIYPASQTWDWEVHVLENTTVNATCREGGKIIVYAGLIKLLEADRDMLGSVIGHEVAHAVLGHSRSSISKNGLIKATSWVIAESLKMGSLRREQATRMLTRSILYPASRRQEIEADVLGVELAVRAGFDYSKASQVWHKFMTLQERSEAESNLFKDREANFMSDHPIDSERITLIEKLAPHVDKLQNNLNGGKQ